MIEIRFHGRGGQGAVVASEVLARAAFKEGKDVQAFPFFGVERRGAPVTAYARFDDRPIRVKSSVYEPDYVVVLDPSLLGTVDVREGLKEDGLILLNTDKAPEETGLVASRLAAVDATDIAIRHGLGSKAAPIVNTAILGAFAKATGVVGLDSILESITESVPAKVEANVAAAQEAYDRVQVQGS